MLIVDVRTDNEEFYNQDTKQFFYKTTPVRLEHSLYTVSLWEAKYKKPFLSDLPKYAKTDAETADYIRLMVLDDITPEMYESILKHNLSEIQEYIADSQTATTVADTDKKQGRSSEIITSELIYYWMFSAQIPKDCEHWHIQRLITLIRVFAAKQEKPKKMSPGEIAARNRDLNAKRLKQMNTKG